MDDKHGTEKTASTTEPDVANSTKQETENTTVIENEETIAASELQETDEPPDGGYGWLVVLGAFLTQIATFGISTCWGIMQDYYEQNVFKDTVPNAALQLSFVGTLAFVASYSLSPIAQIFYSLYGSRVMLMTGTLFATLGLMMASLSTKIWQLYLSQGICFGLGVCILFVVTMAVTPQYFARRRGVAMGIVAGGSAMGGLIIPFIVTPLNRSLGAGWTYRVLGFISLGFNSVSCIFVKDRKRKQPLPRKRLTEIVQFSVFKDTTYSLWVFAAAVQLVAYFTPFFFVPSYATAIGLSDSQGSSLVAVISGLNALGRVLCGIIADRIGPVNANIIFLTISGSATFLIWTFAYSYNVLMAYAAVFGIFCGSYSALFSPLTAKILGMERLNSGLSLLLVFNAVAIFGINVTSAIESASNAKPFLAVKMISGFVYILAAMIMIIIKLRMSSKFFAKV